MIESIHYYRLFNVYKQSYIQQKDSKSYNNIMPRSFLALIIITINLSVTFNQQPSSQIIQIKPLIAQEQIDRFKQKILGQSLSGKWQCIEQLFYQPLTQCSFFNIPTQAQIVNNLTSQHHSLFASSYGSLEGFFYAKSQQLDTLYLIVYESKYVTDHVVEMNIDLKSSDKFEVKSEGNQTIVVLYQKDKVITTVGVYGQERELAKVDVTVDFQVYVKLEDFKLLLQSKNIPIHLPISLRVFSQSITFGGYIQSQSFSAAVSLLSLFIIAQSLLTLLNPPLPKENASHTRTVMFRISQWFILHMYCFIFLISKQYLTLGLKYFDTELGYLVYLALVNVGVALLFLRKYEMVLEKFMNRGVMLKGVAFVVGYWLMANIWMHSGRFWVVQVTIMFLWQVLHSMITGGKGGLSRDLLAFMLLSRLPLIYMLISDSNIFKSPSLSYNSLALLFFTTLLNWLIIHLQSLKGGQFLIPNQIIPGFYNYYFTSTSQQQKLKEQCPICTNPLNKPADAALQLTQVQSSAVTNLQSKSTQLVDSSPMKPQVSDTIATTVKYMKTPCGHMFHIYCLTKWMQAKLVCPYCRSTLPQLAQLQKE